MKSGKSLDNKSETIFWRKYEGFITVLDDILGSIVLLNLANTSRLLHGKCFIWLFTYNVLVGKHWK